MTKMDTTRVCRLDFPKREDDRGNLSFVEGARHLPFEIARAYWIYDVPGGKAHRGHAYRRQMECLVALSGSFDVVVRYRDGRSETYTLNRSYQGLFVPAGLWRQLENFATNSLCLVLSSGPYDPGEYIRDFDLYAREAVPAAVSEMLSEGNPRAAEDSAEACADALVACASENDLVACASENAPIACASENAPVSYGVDDCRVVTIPTYHDREGNLTAVNGRADTGFDLSRVYYLYDIPYGSTRGGHAHRGLTQWLVAASGSFDVLLDDGRGRRRLRLDRPDQALEIKPGIWRELEGFASGAVALVLASAPYDEADYLRRYDDFLRFKQIPGHGGNDR